MEEHSLVDQIENFPFLWNKKDKQFKDKIAIENAWQTISAIMGYSVQECMDAWNSVRLKYVRERRKQKNIPSGSGSSATSWDLYPRLGFLDRAISTRRTKGNILPPKPSPKHNAKPSDIWQQELDSMFSEGSQTQSQKAQEPEADSSDDGHSLPTTPQPGKRAACLNTQLPSVSMKRQRLDQTRVKASEVQEVLVQTCNKVGTALTEMFTEKPDYDENELFGLSVAKSLQLIKNDKKRTLVKARILSIIAEEGFSD